MCGLLIKFWEWARISPKEYALYGFSPFGGDADELYFPLFDELVEQIKSLLQKEKLSDDEIDDVLTVLALDNETENLLDYLKAFNNQIILSRIIEAGVDHLQPQARWQVAELLYHIKPTGYMELLEQLSRDPHEYVRKRAKNCLS